MSATHDRSALQAAAARHRDAVDTARDTERDRDRQIVDAALRGVPQVLIAQDTGLSRERVRQIERKGGVTGR